MAVEVGDSEFICGLQMIHEDIVNMVKIELTDDESLYYMSEFFKMFVDGTRLKIINSLMISEMCVCDISAVIGMNQSVISHHLKILRDARVIKFRREGKIVYYSLCDEHIKLIFDQGLTHIKEKNEKH
jgi:ArsR family transcriptional regulator